MKRGQFTLFAILGVIIIIIVGLILVYNSTLLSDSRTELSEELVLSQEAIEYYNIVSECIQYSGDISLLNLAAQGGFYTVQEPYHDTGFSKIPYFFYEGQETNYIGKDVFIAEFIESFEFEILSCLNEYESYGDILVVDERSIEYEVDLEDDNIFVDLKIPTEITVSNRT